MHRIFGKKKAAPAPGPSLSDAASKIDERSGNIDRKIAALDRELATYRKQMKGKRGAALQHIKRRAMQTLKRKRMYEAQRDQLANQAFNIDQTAFAIDTVKDTVTTIDAIKAAKSTLQTQTKQINIDEIDDIQDDLADMFEDMAEINESLGRNYALEDLDESELDAELADLEDELEGEIGEEEGASFLAPAGMPVEPSGALPAEPAAPQAVAETKVDEFGLPVAAPEATS